MNVNELDRLKEVLRDNNAAKLIDAVESAREKNVDTLLMTLGAFAGESDLLYCALRYASLMDVAVTFAPQGGGQEASV